MACRRAKWSRIVFSAVFIGLALVSAFPGRARAVDTLYLELGGAGSTPWNIGNIKPGDSGTETVELHNAGSASGDVAIWVDNIASSDYAGDGAALERYLYLDIYCDYVTANFNLPARVADFPRSAGGMRYLKIPGLGAGATVTIFWHWAFLETGLPQNDAQGDGLSFSINYRLENAEKESPPPSTLEKWLQINVLGQITSTRVSLLGVILSPCTASDPSGNTTLQLNAGTRVTTTGGTVPEGIQLSASDSSPEPPSGLRVLGTSYVLDSYTYSTPSGPVTFSRPVRLTLAYDASQISADNATFRIGYYDASTGWKIFEALRDEEDTPGRISVLIRQGATFSLLTTAPGPLPPTTTSPTFTPATPTPEKPTTPPATPVDTTPSQASPPATAPTISPTVPAQFELSDLTLDPARVGPGEPAVISVRVQNTGGLEGEDALDLVVNGAVERSLNLVLAPGAATRVSFTLVLDKPGTYTIEVGNLVAELTVVVPEIPAFRSDILLWTISLAVTVAGLLAYLFSIKFKLT